MDSKNNTPINFESNRSNQANYIYHQEDVDLCFGRHLHNSFEIVFVSQGLLKTTVFSTVYFLRAGEAIILFPNVVHSYETVGHSESHLIVFSTDMIPHFTKYISGKQYANPVLARSKVLSLMRKIQPENNPYLNKGYSYQLVGLFDEATTLVDAAKTTSGLMTFLIKEVESHFSERISLRDIAKRNGYSYTYLSGLFHRSLGLNFCKYVNLFRIDKAVFLLSNSEEPVTDIAYDCGFSNVRNFNREFLAEKGIAPTEYRKNTKMVARKVKVSTQTSALTASSSAQKIRRYRP